MNTKIRLIVTNVCNRKCPGCCNVEWKGPQPIPMTHEKLDKYQTIIITGGEPMLYPEKIVELMDEFDFQNFILYTASICDREWLREIIYHPNLLGITFTIHDQKGFDDFKILNEEVKSILKDIGGEMSLRVNIFASDVVLHPIDMSGWNVKFIEWIKDCPLPTDEDFGTLPEPWGGKLF